MMNLERCEWVLYCEHRGMKGHAADGTEPPSFLQAQEVLGRMTSALSRQGSSSPQLWRGNSRRTRCDRKARIQTASGWLGKGLSEAVSYLVKQINTLWWCLQSKHHLANSREAPRTDEIPGYKLNWRKIGPIYMGEVQWPVTLEE